METKATRRAQYNPKCMFLAFELALKDWKLAFSTRLADKPLLRSIKAGDLGALSKTIESVRKRLGLKPSIRIVSCYEAGREGFWLHRCLLSMGIQNRIVDSASIEVNRRKRRAKSDRLDASKLVTMLIRSVSGEERVWSEVRVPSPEEEDRRHLHRELRTLKQERTRVSNRIKGYLANQGIRLRRVREVSIILLKGRLWDGSDLGPGTSRSSSARVGSFSVAPPADPRCGSRTTASFE